MAEAKPYRIYGGGRARRGSSASSPRRAAAHAQEGRGDGGSAKPAAAKRRRWLRRSLLAACCLVALVAAWGVAGFLVVQSGVAGANQRLPPTTRAALTAQHGSLLSSPSDILLLSVDHADGGSVYRQTDDNSDAMMILRSEPGRHRLVYLSIPRDLRVDIAGYGEQKINSAMQFGGPALAIRTVEQLTGLPVNHVAIVDFSTFEQLIAALGGVEIDIPENILSNRFDCPYATEARCLAWPGWRFHKGWQHLDAKRALIYSRIRDNELNPADTDMTREQHQQQLMQAVLGELVSARTFLELPFDGSSLVAPLTTDLSALDLLELGWDKFRDSSVVHCRLGGSPLDLDGVAYLQASPDNGRVIQTVLGAAAPVAPSASSLYAPGCTS